MSATASDRPTLSDAHLDAYLSYIKWPSSGTLKADEVKPSDDDNRLSYVNGLIRHQLCNVPFENLDLHYSTVKGVSLDPDHLFHKIVERRSGRGGYCMQNNSFFATVLRSLGYNVYSAGARVSKALDEPNASSDGPPAFGGFSHQVNIVTINNRKYFADVGFGSMGPTHLIPLQDGYTATHAGHGDDIASSLRLTCGHAGNNTSCTPEQELWIYSCKFSRSEDESRPWIPCYSFSEREFFPEDFNVMNHYTSTSRTSFFTRLVICQKFLMSEDESSIIGDITLNNAEIKERKFGKSHELKQIKTERDRIEALEQFMGVKLNGPEQAGIRGFPSALAA